MQIELKEERGESSSTLSLKLSGNFRSRNGEHNPAR